MNASHRLPTRSSIVSIISLALATTALAAPALAEPAATASSAAKTVAQAGCTASDADPALLSAETLEWPSIAESRGSYATRLAVLSVDIGADDRASDAVLVQSSGDPALDAAALRHVTQQRFRARRAACSPVAGRALVEYDFAR